MNHGNIMSRGNIIEEIVKYRENAMRQSKNTLDNISEYNDPHLSSRLELNEHSR